MNFLKTEEQLIKTQLYLNEEVKRTELLSRLDKASEFIEAQLPEVIPITMKIPESLSKDSKLVLPLKVVGKMLGVGRHKQRYYTEEDLKKSVDLYKDKKIPIKVDHRHLEIGSLIGAIDKLFWDDIEKVIRYEGHINDETQARNILDGMVTDVSATIASELTYDPKYGVVGRHPEYTELSLVCGGAFSGNTIEAVI